MRDSFMCTHFAYPKNHACIPFESFKVVFEIVLSVFILKFLTFQNLLSLFMYTTIRIVALLVVL